MGTLRLEVHMIYQCHLIVQPNFNFRFLILRSSYKTVVTLSKTEVISGRPRLILLSYLIMSDVFHNSDPLSLKITTSRKLLKTSFILLVVSFLHPLYYHTSTTTSTSTHVPPVILPTDYQTQTTTNG